jgi:hypothetical protein
MNALEIGFDTVTSPTEVRIWIRQKSGVRPEELTLRKGATKHKPMIAMGQSILTVPCPVRDLDLVLKIAPETMRRLRNAENSWKPPFVRNGDK